MIRAVIFDKDGVLTDSEWVNLDAAKLSFRKIGIRLTKDDLVVVKGRHPVDYIALLAKRYTFSIPRISRIQHRVYRVLHRKAKLNPYVKQLITSLRKQDYITALVTASNIDIVRTTLNKFRLTRLFDAVVTFEDCSKRKPAPDVYRLAAKRLHLKPKECIVIEDSKVGVEAAKRAGMTCVAYGSKDGKDADYRIHDFRRFRMSWLR